MYWVECVTWPGLGPALWDELTAKKVRFQRSGENARALIADPWALAEQLRCAHNVYIVHRYAVPRPKALLGQQIWDELMDTARAVVARGVFATITLDAAGAESTVMQRVLTTMAQTLGLRVVSDEADLHVRVRSSEGAWDVLFRVSPRPLGTRVWRVCNYPGAVNGVVAAAMVRFGGAETTDRVLNIGCGSGTIAIERLLQTSATQVTGCDTEAAARACATENVAAAGFSQNIQINDWDATQLPLGDECIDVVYADLPFGQRIGTHTENLRLYPALLREAARVLARGGRMVLLSHEIRLLRSAVADIPALQVQDELQVTVGGMAPLMMYLEKT